MNAAAVLVGSLAGLFLGRLAPPGVEPIALAAIGIVTLFMGVKMALESRSILIVMASLVAGGVLGVVLRLPEAVAATADLLAGLVGGRDGRFQEGFIAATVLFCIGPMTLLGCMQDGLERKIELLSLKSALDLVAGFFLAVSLGLGVVFSVLSVLVLQGTQTLLASQLKPLSERPALMRETTAVGGLILIAIGINLLGLREESIPSEAFLPSLALAPLLASAFLRGPDHEGG